MSNSLYWRKLLAFFYACLIVISLIGLVALVGKNLGNTSPTNTNYADFVGYYRCASMVLSEDRTKIYDRDLQLQYFNALTAADKSTQYIYSQNPPFFFVLLTPFALFPLNLSFKLWIALSIGSVVFVLFLLMNKLHGSKFPVVCLFVAAALVSAPGWIGLSVGQMSCFITALAILFYFGLVFKRDLLCGIALALISTKFQYVFFLLIPLLAKKRWRAIAYAAGAGISLLAFSALVVGSQNVLNYPAMLVNAETTKDYLGVFPEYMISLRGVLSLVMDRHNALLANTVILFLGLIPLFLLWKHQARNDFKESSAWAMTITIILALFLSAHTHIYDDVLLLLPAALTLPLLWRVPATIESRTAGGAMADLSDGDLSGGCIKSSVAAWLMQALLLTFPLLSWLALIACNNYDMVKRTPFALINLALAVCSIVCYRQCARQVKKKQE